MVELQNTNNFESFIQELDQVNLQIVPVDEIPKVEFIKNFDIDNCKNINKLYSFFINMEELCKKENGIGLSAVQLGIPLKLFIVNFNDKFRYFVNCEYEFIKKSEDIFSVEGCLSIKNASGKTRAFCVPRKSHVRIKGFELVGMDSFFFKEVDLLLDKKYATVFQHEIDHHRGVLISSIGREIFTKY